MDEFLEQDLKDQEVIFDEQQQRKVDQIVQERLARQKQSHDAEVLGIRIESRAQLGKTTQDDIDNVIASEAARKAAFHLRTAQLQAMFNDSKGWNQRAIDNPTEYKLLRQEMIAHGIIGEAKRPSERDEADLSLMHPGVGRTGAGYQTQNVNRLLEQRQADRLAKVKR